MKTVGLADAALFLDFDGTLVPLAESPDAVRLQPATREIVAGLAARTEGAVAMISGRGIAQLSRLLAPLRLPMAGAHGAEQVSANGSVTSRPIDQGPIDAAFAAISGYASRYGLLVERKHAGISLHFRSHPHLEDEARRFVADLASVEAAFRVMQGNMVAELTLAHINKGNAIRAFMAEAPFAGRIPVCAGDDTTDEDSFAAVRSMGGAGIKVGAGASRANYRLADVDAFVDWLRTCLNADHISFEGLTGCG